MLLAQHTALCSPKSAPASLRASAATPLDRRRVLLGLAAVSGAAVCPPAQRAHAAEVAAPIGAPVGVPVASAAVAAQAASPVAQAEASAPAREFLASAAGGAAQRLAKELLLHPIDTVRCRLELQGASRSLLTPGLFDDLYAGVLPALTVGTPAGALFFATKDSVKKALKDALGASYAKEPATIAAVLIAQLPYWLVRTPAELLKTRSQAASDAAGSFGSSAERSMGALARARAIVADEGPRGLWLGFGSNIAYAAPTDVVKFVAYDAIKRSAKRAKGAELSPADAAVAGAFGSAFAQAVCTPLDVVRTRVIASAPAGAADAEPSERDFVRVAQQMYAEEGPASFLAGVLPRVARAFGSGAIGFGAYEGTRRLFGVGLSE